MLHETAEELDRDLGRMFVRLPQGQAVSLNTDVETFFTQASATELKQGQEVLRKSQTCLQNFK